jgi:hypothetical protein
MEFKYKKLMEENGLTLNQIPEDAKTGVDEINKVLRGITMRERAGKKVLPMTLKKLATMDKWVTYEILDYLHDTDKNDDDIPFEADDVLEGDENINNEQKTDPVGLKIDEVNRLCIVNNNNLHTQFDKSNKTNDSFISPLKPPVMKLNKV